MEEKIKTTLKTPKSKSNDRVIITKYKNIFSKDYTENWSREKLFINSALKTNPWTYTIEDLNVEKIIGSFYKRKLLLKLTSGS